MPKLANKYMHACAIQFPLYTKHEIHSQSGTYVVISLHGKDISLTRNGLRASQLHNNNILVYASILFILQNDIAVSGNRSAVLGACGFRT